MSPLVLTAIVLLVLAGFGVGFLSGASTRKPLHPRARYLLDIAERSAATYAEVYLGLWLASGLGVEFLTDLSSADKALTATLPTLLAVAKGVLARGVGSADTAAALPEAGDTPEADAP